MKNAILKKIISDYLLGKSSIKISKELKISKPVILKILKKEGITRKRDRCKSLDINEENGKYSVTRICNGCGQEVKTISKDKTIACRNHFNKINGNSLCMDCSSKSQLGEGNSFYGKKHTNETKIRISKSRVGKCKGEHNAMSNDVWKEKARQKLIERWESGELEETRKFMSEKMKETRRLGKLPSVIVSKKEKLIKKEIEKMGINVIGSHRVDTKICDLYIPSLNLIIEYNGDYWHCNPKKYKSTYFNKKKNLFAWEMWEYDKNKLELIKNYGYNLEVIWESDLKDNNKLLKNIITKYVTNNNSTPEWSRKDEDTSYPF
jgi:G:T-mismatch repair DNA endonuclease (very short patch repair protein)